MLYVPTWGSITGTKEKKGCSCFLEISLLEQLVLFIYLPYCWSRAYFHEQLQNIIMISQNDPLLPIVYLL
jgi:hypothetical protein